MMRAANPGSAHAYHSYGNTCPNNAPPPSSTQSRRFMPFNLNSTHMQAHTTSTARPHAHGMQSSIPLQSQGPTQKWEQMKKSQRVDKIELLPPNTPRKPGHLRIVCISDTHSRHSNLEVPDGDVLIHAGDFSNTGAPFEVRQFDEFLGTLPHKYKIVIAGNHDLSLDHTSYDRLWKRFNHAYYTNPQEVKQYFNNALYLEDQAVTIEGYKFYGTPWQPRFGDWAFGMNRGDTLQAKWNMIPADTDVLITHTPPIGHGDLCRSGARAGDVELLEHVQKHIQPKYHIFGHIHEGFGITTDGITQYVNASTCTLHYQPTQQAVLLDLPLRPSLDGSEDQSTRSVSSLDPDSMHI
eukprot:Clim_evm67s147 gene=Clim_evmTU67s147